MEARKRIRARILFLVVSMLVLCVITRLEKKQQNHVSGKMAEQEKEWKRVEQEGFPCIVTDEWGNIVGTKRGELLRKVVLDYIANIGRTGDHNYHIQADAFSACPNLKTLILPNQGVLDYISTNAFRGCSEDLVVYCDEGCYAWNRLQELGIMVKEIPDGDFSWRLLGEDTNALKQIQQKLASAHNNSILTEQEMRQFYGEPFFMMTESGQLFPSMCDSLGEYTFCNEIYLPRDANTLVATFPNCIICQPLTIPKNIVEIGDSSFFAAPLSGITFEAGSRLQTIGDKAFLAARFEEDQEIQLPEGLQKMGERAFDDCQGLQKITIPESVQTIGSHCFRLCRSLERVVILNSDINLGEEVFDDEIVNPELKDDEIDMDNLDANFIPNNRLTIVCHPGSNAEKYAKEHGLQVEYLK